MSKYRTLTQCVHNLINHKNIVMIVILFITLIITLLFSTNVNKYIPKRLEYNYINSDDDLDLYNYTLDLGHGYSWQRAYLYSGLNKSDMHYSKSEAISIYINNKNNTQNVADTPKDFLNKYYYDLHEINRLKREEKLNLISVYNFIPFLLCLIILIYLVYVLTEYSVSKKIHDIILKKNYNFSSRKLKYIAKNLKYLIKQRYLNLIIYQYLFLILPLIISVISGTFGLFDTSNFFEHIISYLINYSGLTLSVIQFIRIYNRFIYDIIHQEV